MHSPMYIRNQITRAVFVGDVSKAPATVSVFPWAADQYLIVALPTRTQEPRQVDSVYKNKTLQM